MPRVGPEQVHGIELDVYAHELATATVWISYIQWLRDNGFGRPSEPILKPLETVTQMDAMLAHDEKGNPLEPEWPKADVIAGNPPFLGGKRLRAELTDAYVDDLFTVYRDMVPREADLVCYWFEKAREQIESGELKRVGLLATQGVLQSCYKLSPYPHAHRCSESLERCPDSADSQSYYIQIDPKHLTPTLTSRYFRFNNRKTDDAGRFAKTLRSLARLRLTYGEFTGKVM